MNAESTREALDVASLAGDILLASGAEIFRVEETIDRIARAYGVNSSDAFVLSSGIFLTAESGKKQESNVFHASCQIINVAEAQKHQPLTFLWHNVINQHTCCHK